MSADPMKRTILRISTVNMLPYFKWHQGPKRLEATGLMKWYIDYLCYCLEHHFNYTLIITNDGENEPGTQVAPGNWTCAVGKLITKEADLYGGFYFMLPELWPHVDFSTSFGGTYFTVLSGPPVELHSKNPSLFESVSYEIWILLGISWVLVTVLYLWISGMERQIFKDAYIPQFSVVSYGLTFYGLLFQRGFENLPETASRRILVTGWLFLVFILTIDLATAFSSKLAVQDVPKRIDCVEDILKYPSIKPYVPRGTGPDTALFTSEREELQAVWRQALRFDSVVAYNEIFKSHLLDDIRAGKAVMVGTYNSHFLGAVNAACRMKHSPFYVGRESFLFTPFAAMFRRGLEPEIVEYLNLLLPRFAGMGFQKLLWKEMANDSDPCFKFEVPQISYSPTTLAGISGVFKVLGLGLAVSFLGFLYEFFQKFSEEVLKKKMNSYHVIRFYDEGPPNIFNKEIHCCTKGNAA